MAMMAAAALAPGAALGQRPELERGSNAGPRMGVTYVTGPRAREKLAEYQLDAFMSQFGWHFEQMVFPSAGGPSFVIEEVALIGAVDQGRAIPSLTLLMGVRMPSGLEFGMGPNVTPAGAALALGVGKSLRYGGVTIPVNLALVRSPGAYRFSFLFGYAIRGD
jgi:hypothetical protein